MQRSVVAQPVSRRAVGTGRLDAQTAFVEALLRCERVTDCAHAAVEYVARHLHASRAVLAVRSGEAHGERLDGLTGHGIDARDVSAVRVALDDVDHPLVRAFYAGAPTELDAEHVVRSDRADERPEPARDGRATGTARLVAIPVPWELPANDGPVALLVTTPLACTNPELAWFVDLLGRALRRLVELERLRGERRHWIELEQASHLKSQFLANMSHEFRTPLNAILGYTSMLLHGVNGPLGPAQRKNLARVDSNARHLLCIVNDILDISRIEAGRMPVHESRFDLTALVDEVLAELDPLIVRSQLAVRREVPRRLPALRTDRAKVKQIVSNLLSNALKFTPAGSVTVSVAHNRAAREIWVSVADTGIGVAERDKERIFGAFQQVDASPTRPYGGAGLGLAICRRLAGLLGGHLKLTTRLGRGSTFTLVLPTRPRKT